MKSKRIYADAVKTGSKSNFRRTGAVGAGIAAAVGAVNALYNRSTKPKAKAKVYKKRVYKPRMKSTLKRRVTKLEKAVADETSMILYKYDTTDTVRPAAASATYSSRSALDNALIELAIAQARFFDPAAPGTLVTGSLASPTYEQRIDVACVAQCVITNNYQIPCYITCGVVVPKTDTTETPQSSFATGLVDQGNPDNTSTLLSWKDSRFFSDIWRIKGGLKHIRLNPGESYVLKHYQKSFKYDPSYTDTQTDGVGPKTKSAVFMYRVQGVLAHDTSASERGIAPAGVDVHVKNDITVKYNSGGASVRTIVLNENSAQTFTNGAVVSQIVVDNQSYSIS